MIKFQYPPQLPTLEQANFDNRRAFLGLPTDPSRIGATKTAIIGGVDALTAVSPGGVITQDALTRLEARVRSWTSLGIAVPKPSVNAADTVQVQRLIRRVNEMATRLHSAAETLHTDYSRSPIDDVKKITNQVRTLRRTLIGGDGRGAQKRSMVSVGLADPQEVIKLSGALVALASSASVFLGQLSSWRSYHLTDWRNKLTDIPAECTAAGNLVQGVVDLCHQLTAQSTTQTVVRALLPVGAGEHEVHALADAFDRVLKMRPDIELAVLSRAVERRLAELADFGSEFAKVKYFMSTYGHLVPQGASGTANELLALALVNIGAETSSQLGQQDPFDVAFTPRAYAGLISVAPQTAPALAAPPESDIARLTGPTDPQPPG